MTVNSKKGRTELDLLADDMVEDILAASDEEILAEFRETDGDPDKHAAEMRVLFEKRLIAANKSRLTAAKVALAAEPARRRNSSPIDTAIVDMAGARARLRTALTQPSLTIRLTMAARNESEMSDSDVLSMIEDLEDLGILSKEGN